MGLKKIQILFLLCLFVGCRSTTDQKIIGEWLFVSDNQDDVLLSFVDSKYANIISRPSEIINHISYTIYDDTLSFYKKESDSTSRFIQFKIMRISNRSLEIEELAADSLTYFLLNDRNSDNDRKKLAFKRLTKRNNIIFDRIAMYCTDCFWGCSEFFHEIDINGDYFYSGIKGVDLPGNYSSNLSTEQLNSVLRMIRQVDRLDLNTSFSENMLDVQYCGIFLKRGNTMIHNSAAVFNHLPKELEALYRYISGLHRLNQMKEDPDIDNKFKLKKYYDAISSLPPPPAPPSN